jgi:hypothetical protein
VSTELIMGQSRGLSADIPDAYPVQIHVEIDDERGWHAAANALGGHTNPHRSSAVPPVPRGPLPGLVMGWED